MSFYTSPVSHIYTTSIFTIVAGVPFCEEQGKGSKTLRNVVGDAGDETEVLSCIENESDASKTTNIVRKCWACEESRGREGRIVREQGMQGTCRGRKGCVEDARDMLGEARDV